jgi:LCP family protein required for cell wall assembly
LGRQLPQFTFEPQATFTPLPTSATLPATPVVEGTEPAQEVTRSTPDVPSPVCGQTEPMVILVLGIDEVEQADMIRVVRVDFQKRQVMVLSIPRDFWVPIPGLEEHNITQFRINAAYGYGEYFNGRGQGVVKFSETMYQNYGVIFDRYVVAHFTNFSDLVDQIGGVDIYLEEPIGAYASAGHHHYDGKSALLFVRQRTADLDAYRIQRQSAILKGLYEKLSKPEYLVKLPVLGVKFIKDKTVITDLRLQDVYTFNCFIREMNRDSLVFVDIPYDLYTPMVTNFGRHIKVPKPDATDFIQDMIINGVD